MQDCLLVRRNCKEDDNEDNMTILEEQLSSLDISVAERFMIPITSEDVSVRLNTLKHLRALHLIQEKDISHRLHHFTSRAGWDDQFDPQMKDEVYMRRQPGEASARLLVIEEIGILKLGQSFIT